MNAYEIGKSFEDYFIKKTGAKKVPSSGSKWYAKLDAMTGNIVWSLKKTTKPSFTVNSNLIKEMNDAVKSPAGYGLDAIPAMCVSIDSDELVVIGLDDFMMLLSEKKDLFSEQTENTKSKKSNKLDIFK